MTFASVLFAAGKGTRMRPLTEWVPKPALPILDVPLAAYSLTSLLAARPPTVMNVGHLAEVMTHRLTDHVDPATVELFVEEPEPFGGAATLHALRNRLQDPVLTHNADTLTTVDFAELVAAHSANGADATIAARLVERHADFEIAGGGAVRLVDRREKGAVAGAVFLGSAVFGGAALDLIPDGRPRGLAETVLGPLARRGSLAVHVHHGYCKDVGTPSEYLDASLDVLAGAGPALPDGWPGEIVELDGGRAYLGRGCEVAGDSLGPGAIVLEGATVGKGARVQEAIVLPGERVPAGAVVTRSVWARGAPVDAGR